MDKEKQQKLPLLSSMGRCYDVSGCFWAESTYTETIFGKNDQGFRLKFGESTKRAVKYAAKVHKNIRENAGKTAKNTFVQIYEKIVQIQFWVKGLKYIHETAYCYAKR